MSTLATPQTTTTTWNIDPAHSVAEFKVKHMMISNVKGSGRVCFEFDRWAFGERLGRVLSLPDRFGISDLLDVQEAVGVLGEPLAGEHHGHRGRFFDHGGPRDPFSDRQPGALVNGAALEK